MKIYRIAQYNEYEDIEEYYEEDEDSLDSILNGIGTPIQGVCYHGTQIERGESIWSELSEEYSDWEAFWVTHDEEIAEEFSQEINNEDYYSIVFRGKLNLKKAFTFSYDLWQDTLSEYYEDPREMIPLLKQKGYDGWITIGSVGSRVYEDIAVFGGEVKFNEYKSFDGEDWGEYENI